MLIKRKKYSELLAKEKLAEKLSILNYAKTFELDYMRVLISLIKQLGGKATIEKCDLINNNEYVIQSVNPMTNKIELSIEKVSDENDK